MGEYTSNQTKKGWLTAILELGAWLGTLLSGFLAEAISRKYGILVAVTVFVIGVVIQATAQSGGADVILAGRFVTGMGVGSLAMIVPIYNSEVAPPEVRGALVAVVPVCHTFVSPRDQLESDALFCCFSEPPPSGCYTLERHGYPTSGQFRGRPGGG